MTAARDRPAACAAALDRARAHSPYLARQMGRAPDIADLLAAGEVEAAWRRAGSIEAATPAARLRRRRNAAALVAAIADLAGVWDFDALVRALSDLADALVDDALAHAFAERFPGEPVRGLAIVALGKHGSRELNYSSDIDPLLLFDPETLPRRGREEPGETAVRLGRRMVALLGERDADGIVFRVDLRLRPAPEVTPIVLPVDAAISYYESTATGWEQAAFIRARAAAGDLALGRAFLAAIRPFVWRRSLDFGAIRAITDMTRRIRDHHAGGQRFGPGYDLKRGRGGIREVEFFAQAHQLIHGGRNPALRAPATRDALRVLAGAGVIGADAATALDDAYVLFRTMEHRLQMVDDRQTHSLPIAADALDGVARLHGLSDGAALVAALAPHVTAVASIYDRLDERPGEGDEAPLSARSDALTDQLAALGLADPAAAAARIAAWRSGGPRALRGAAARTALEEVLPRLVAALASAPDPDAAVRRLDTMFDRLPSTLNFVRLLGARPALIEILADLLSHAPTLADALAGRAALFDGLIDATAFAPLPPAAALVAEMAQGEAGEDYQLLLDRVRRQVGERRFALGVQIVRGTSDPLDVAAGYARLAEAAVEVVADATIAAFEAAHGRVPGGELVILALGRFGGGLLTHASDLDLVYLFTGDFAAESVGARPLGATPYFNRLAQRLTNALSVPTAAGPLYEVDTRLRPSGAQGLLAVSLDSFARYQAEAAWSWEHMALTRARPVYGSAEARDALGAIIAQVLGRRRDMEALTADAARMRADIARHKPAQGPFDVKLLPGGLVDLEFAAQVAALRAGMIVPAALGAAIDRLAEAGHLPPGLRAAHDLLTRYLVVARLVSPDGEAPSPRSEALVARACGEADWPALLESLGAARQSVAAAWSAIIGPAAKGDD